MLDIIAGVGARGFLLTEPDCSLLLEGRGGGGVWGKGGYGEREGMGGREGMGASCIIWTAIILFRHLCIYQFPKSEILLVTPLILDWINSISVFHKKYLTHSYIYYNEFR